MTEPLTVFVYGHYDSRGGTTAIAAVDRETADHVYNEELFSASDMIRDFLVNPERWTWDPRDPKDQPAAQDFLFEARLHNADGIGSDVELDDEIGPDGQGGEVWAELGDGNEFLDYYDKVLNLLYVPGIYHPGEPKRVERSWCSDPRPDDHRQSDLTYERSPNGGWVGWRMEPASMFLCTLPNGETHDIDTDEGERPDGWVHPRWTDDAFGFILMDRRDYTIPISEETDATQS